jgi:hypothetical protein
VKRDHKNIEYCVLQNSKKLNIVEKLEKKIKKPTLSLGLRSTSSTSYESSQDFTVIATSSAHPPVCHQDYDSSLLTQDPVTHQKHLDVRESVGEEHEPI